MESDLAARVYEAAAIPELWPVVLSEVGTPIDAPAAGIVSIERQSGMRFLCNERYSGTYEGYSSRGANYRNLRAERALARGYYGFLPDTELCLRAELEADPIYTEFLYPNGLGWSIGSPVTAPASDLTYFDFARETGRDAFSRNDAEYLDQWRPVLARAALLSVRLGLAEARSTAQTLSTIGLPGAVIGDGGRVLAANPEFSALAPRIAVAAFDRLALANPEAALLLNAVLAGDAATGSIPIKGEFEAPPLVLHLVPVQRGARDVFVRAAWVAIVTPVVAAGAPGAEILSGLFDLTPAEARVAQSIAGGDGLDTIALDNGLSVQTIRNQLNAVLRKTGTHRQAELVRLLLSATPIRS